MMTTILDFLPLFAIERAPCIFFMFVSDYSGLSNIGSTHGNMKILANKRQVS